MSTELNTLRALSAPEGADYTVIVPSVSAASLALADSGAGVCAQADAASEAMEAATAAAMRVRAGRAAHAPIEREKDMVGKGFTKRHPAVHARTRARPALPRPQPHQDRHGHATKPDPAQGAVLE